MSIQSTKQVSRNWAISRIRLICQIANKKMYRDLEMVTGEMSEQDIQGFIDDFDFDDSNLDQWTNRMIEQIVDKPFFRESAFDNYSIVE